MIETRHLTKRFGDRYAVRDLSLKIGQGELFALLGVNGAGKTTTVRMLSCLTAPTAGEAYVGGFRCGSQNDGIRRIIGLSPQDTAVAERLTARENLLFMAGLYGFGKADARARADRIAADLRLEEALDRRAGTLSGGWKRRLSIAMALIGEPKVLFLDEPTLGLDVLARRELWRVIERLKGTITVVLTTHYMEEAERLSDRLGILLDGRLAACGTPKEIITQTGTDSLENAFVAVAEKEGSL